MLIVPIRVAGRYYGGLIFCARAVGRFTRDDVLVANRIADHVALALSHQSLAEQVRRNEELRAQAEKGDLLDELLASVTSSAQLPVIFDRVSDVTQKVLAHDAVFLAVREPDTRHARIYASKIRGNVRIPDLLDVPPALLANPDWEYDIVDDLQADPNQAHLWVTQAGFRSALRLPIGWTTSSSAAFRSCRSRRVRTGLPTCRSPGASPNEWRSASRASVAPRC
jgi:GAF domain-containing protein